MGVEVLCENIGRCGVVGEGVCVCLQGFLASLFGGGSRGKLPIFFGLRDFSPLF